MFEFAIRISLDLVAKVPIHNKPVLVQITAWRRPSHKPLSEPVMVELLPHICVARPQLVKKNMKIIVELLLFERQGKSS